MSSNNTQTVLANEVALCVETFGDRADRPVLLVGTSMLTWEDEFCERLAAGSRFVIRYDIRDTGESVGYEPGSPPYTVRDLVADVAGLLDAFDLGVADLVGFSAGGWIAQLTALAHPERIATLTLIAARPNAPGPTDPDLPGHDKKLMAFIRRRQEPDWADRAAVIDFLVERDRRLAGSLPFDEASRREVAARVVDRTENVRWSTTTFAALDSGDRWRERLGEIRAPTLVIHGTEDPFFPYGNGVALAREIPNARLVTVEGMGHELPRAAWDTLISAILEHTSQKAARE